MRFFTKKKSGENQDNLPKSENNKEKTVFTNDFFKLLLSFSLLILVSVVVLTYVSKVTPCEAKGTDSQPDLSSDCLH